MLGAGPVTAMRHLPEQTLRALHRTKRGRPRKQHRGTPRPWRAPFFVHASGVHLRHVSHRATQGYPAPCGCPLTQASAQAHVERMSHAGRECLWRTLRKHLRMFVKSLLINRLSRQCGSGMHAALPCTAASRDQPVLQQHPPPLLPSNSFWKRHPGRKAGSQSQGSPWRQPGRRRSTLPHHAATLVEEVYPWRSDPGLHPPLPA